MQLMTAFAIRLAKWLLCCPIKRSIRCVCAGVCDDEFAIGCMEQCCGILWDEFLFLKEILVVIDQSLLAIAGWIMNIESPHK